MSRTTAPRWACVGVAAVVSLACGGGPVVVFPPDEPSAFALARVPRPDTATDVHYAGAAGIDHAIDLQFVLPDAAATKAFTEALACTPHALEPGDNGPFADAPFDGMDAWWVARAPADARVCETYTVPGYVRDVRLDPLERRPTVRTEPAEAGSFVGHEGSSRAARRACSARGSVPGHVTEGRRGRRANGPSGRREEC